MAQPRACTEDLSPEYQAYKQLIIDIAGDLHPEDIQSLAYTQDVTLLQNHNGLNLLSILEKRGKIGQLKINELSEMLRRVNRTDLISSKIQPHQQKYKTSSQKPEASLGQQEADTHDELCLDLIGLSSTNNENSRETVYNPPNWMVRRCGSSRKSCLEPVDEEVDGLQIKSKPIDKDAVIHVTSSSKEDSTEHCISTMPEGHDSLCRRTSLASSGYFSERGSDVSLLPSCAEPWHEETQTYPETESNQFEEKDLVVRLSPGGKSIHPKQVHKVLVPEELNSKSLAARPASPVPMKKHKVCLERCVELEADDGFQEPTDLFRPRAKSLHSNAKAISKQVQSRIHNRSRTLSLRSEAPSGLYNMSHQSCFSDQSSSESSKAQPIKINPCFIVKKPLVVQEALKLSSSLTFVKPVQVLRITYAGMKYCDHRLGLCISVPEGAIQKGLQLHLEIGMCLYGPFKFPIATAPISPILMLCPQEDIALQKPIEVTLPHSIDGAKESDIKALGIRVVKADHIYETPLGEDPHFLFLDTRFKVVFKQIIQDKNVQEYATFSLEHFCFVSLRNSENMKSVVAKRNSLCICPLYPSRIPAATPGLTYHLPITYYMDPWIESLEEQFLKEGYVLKRNAIRKFTIIEIEKAEIEGKFIGKEAIENDWLVDFEFGVPTGTQTIPAISIDVWRKKIDELEHDIKQFLYPPCFCVVALPKTNNPAFTQLCFETSEGSIVHLKLSLSSESVMLVPRSNSQDISTSVDELLRITGVTEADLNQECSEAVLKQIAEHVIDWRGYAEELSIGQQQIEDIRTDISLSLKLKVIHVFRRWTESQGFKATYRRLVDVCLKQRNGKLAQEVCIAAHQLTYATPE